MPVGNYYSETFFFLHFISLFITFNIQLSTNCSEVLFINWTKTWNTTHNIERRPNLRYGSKKFWANSKLISPIKFYLWIYDLTFDWVEQMFAETNNASLTFFYWITDVSFIASGPDSFVLEKLIGLTVRILTHFTLLLR